MLQDDTILSEWKQKLDHDAETLKAKANLVSIRSVGFFIRSRY